MAWCTTASRYLTMSQISSKRKDSFSVSQTVAAIRLRPRSFLLRYCHQYGKIQSCKSNSGGDSVSCFLLQQKHLVVGKCIKRVHFHRPLLFMVPSHVNVLCYREDCCLTGNPTYILPRPSHLSVFFILFSTRVLSTETFTIVVRSFIHPIPRHGHLQGAIREVCKVIQKGRTSEQPAPQ